MSDRASIDIDCDAGVASSSCDQLKSWAIGFPLEETRSSLITQLLIPHIKELMKCSKEELQKRHIEMLCK